MTKEVVYNAWKQGYRTKEICTRIAADFFGSRFCEREYPGMSEEHAMDVSYGSQDTLYGENTAAECIDHAYYSYENENAPKILERMEAVWDSLREKRFNHKFQKHYKVDYDNSNSNDDHKVFVFEYKSEDGSWSYRERPSRAVVVVDGSNISMVKVKGVDPTLEQTTIMCFTAAARTAAIHKYSRNGRVHPFKINCRVGYSGCEDHYLDIYKRENNMFYKTWTAAKLHVSMAEKIASITDMYIGDVLEILTSALGYKDFEYSKKINEKYGVRFVRPYRNEILSEEDMDFIPKEKSHRRPSRRNVK